MSKRSGRYGAVILAGLVSVGTLGCGLPDSDIKLDPPIARRSASDLDDYTSRYFSFTTDHSGGGQGTDVFYRIYANESAMNSDRSSITSANTVDTQNGYNRMVSLYYRAMATSSSGSNYFEGGDGVTLRIRLFDENFDTNNGNFMAGVYYGSDMVPPSISVPLRGGLNKGFSFFYTNNPTPSPPRGTDANPVPRNTDSDTSLSGANPDTVATWYVNAYAVTVGSDSNFTTYHSRVAELGYIAIRN